MAYNNKVRVVRSDGQEFTFGGTTWSLYGLKGLDAADYTLFTEDRGTGDGSIVTGSRVGERELEIKGRNRNTGDNAANRKAALAFFNPKMTYKVYITYFGRTLWIPGYLGKKPACPFKNVYALQLLTVTFTCPDPYLLSLDDFGKDIAGEEARWGWPFMDNLTYGLIVSKFDFEQVVHLDYDGDVEAGLTVTMTATGKVVNPKISRGASYVRLLQTLQAGDVVEIVTSPTPMARLNGVNVLNKIDRASSFVKLNLQPGSNDFAYAADYGDNSLHVVLRYYKHYLGV